MLQGAAGSGPERHGADHPAFGGLSIFLVFLSSQAWGMGMPAAVASDTFSFVWEAVWH